MRSGGSSTRAGSMEAPAAFVCGMGGPAIGGDLAIAALADRLTRPMLVARGYSCPLGRRQDPPCSARATPATPGALACYAAAEALGRSGCGDDGGGSPRRRAATGPSDRPARRSPAAGGGRLHVLLRGRARGAGAGRPTDQHRDRRRGVAPRAGRRPRHVPARWAPRSGTRLPSSAAAI